MDQIYQFRFSGGHFAINKDGHKFQQMIERGVRKWSESALGVIAEDMSNPSRCSNFKKMTVFKLSSSLHHRKSVLSNTHTHT